MVSLRLALIMTMEFFYPKEKRVCRKYKGVSSLFMNVFSLIGFCLPFNNFEVAL